MAVNGSFVALAFGAGTSDLLLRRHMTSGKTFSPAAEVAEAAVIPLSRHRGPRIAIAGSAIVISAVIGKTLAEGPHAHGLPSDGDLVVWRSLDGGKSWSGGVAVNDVPARPRKACMRWHPTARPPCSRLGWTSAAAMAPSFTGHSRATPA